MAPTDIVKDKILYSNSLDNYTTNFGGSSQNNSVTIPLNGTYIQTNGTSNLVYNNYIYTDPYNGRKFIINIFLNENNELMCDLTLKNDGIRKRYMVSEIKNEQTKNGKKVNIFLVRAFAKEDYNNNLFINTRQKKVLSEKVKRKTPSFYTQWYNGISLTATGGVLINNTITIGSTGMWATGSTGILTTNTVAYNNPYKTYNDNYDYVIPYNACVGTSENLVTSISC